MSVPLDLLINAIVAGLLLGGFYAAVTVGISISFGMLDVVNIAHPAFIILGSYIAYIVNATTGVDPILAAHLMLPAFYPWGRPSTRSTTSPSRSGGRRRCAGSPSSSACCSSPRSG